ncbi:transcriptional regulator ATRX-like [Saccostrea echinata]|uniref:transcriptional regulator ATRX-like n=1 Tax=Saccostrea echinata TaxID=191078 RepID=UPI002A83D0FF|nr:transcriptional regulator ATRX-like [Saccostrea echinata]
MSSRRKPTNTKRADSEEKAETNGTADSDGELDYLPEGTVVVKPEPVGKRGTFSGPEFRSKKKEKKEPSTDFNSASANLGRVSCTACGEQVNTNKSGSVRKHPQLKVLVCKSCYKYHTSGPISRDKDGLDEQCRWCSEGGNLFGCDFCHNAFCKACIIRNLGRSEISNVTEEGKDWKCYVCDNTKLKPLLAECQKVLNYMEAEDKKAKEKMKQATTPKSNDAKKSSDSTIKSNDTRKSNDSKKEATESNSENKASKPTDNKQLMKVLTSGNAPNRSSSPSEFQKAILTQPHAGTTINTEKIVVDPMTGRSTKFEMVYPNANIVQTQYKSYARPVQPKPSSLPTDGVSLPFTGLLPGNVHSIISNLLSMTDNLQQLLRNIQENVIEESNVDKLPFEISLRTLNQKQIEARLTAGNCVKSGVNLFLQEMAMKTSAAGVKAMTLSQKAPRPTLASALLAGSPLDRNGGAMNVDTPHKFDKPGGENSPLVTSTPKPKPSDDDFDVIVLSPSPKKAVTQKSENADACSTLQDNDDVTMVSENDRAEKELLKDAAEEIGDEENDSDNEIENDESSVKEGRKRKDDKDGESVNSENEDGESSEKKGKKKTKKLVIKLGNTSKSSDKKGKNDNSGQEKDDKEKVSSTTKDDDEEDSSNSSRKTRSKKKDETDSEEKECKPIRKTRSKSQNSESDSDSSQSRGKMSPKKKENNDKSKSSEDKKSKKEDLSSKKNLNASKSDKDKKSDSKGKSKDDDHIDKEEKSKDDDDVDKKERVKSGNDTDEEDSDSNETEEESDSDSSKDEDFVVSKSRRSSRRLKKSAKKPDKKKKSKDDSSDFDSDLEKDIEKLSKNPTKSSKSRTTRSSAKSEKSTKKPKRSEGEKKTGKKKGISGDVSSTDDDKTEEDDDNTEIDEPEGEIDMDCSANAQAKEDLLKEMEEEATDEDNDQDSSDSEVIITPKKKRNAVKKAKYTIDSDSATEEDMPKKKKKRDELLDAKLSSSDSDVVSRKKSKKRKAKSSSNDTTETDSEDEFIALGKKKKGKAGKKKAGTGKARKRRRIKAPSSSDDDEEAVSEDENEEGASRSEDEGDPNTPKRLKRKKIRKIKSEKKLTSETKSAAKAEEERRKRIAEKQKIFNGIVQEVDESSPTKCPITKQLVLDFEEETKKPIIEVDKGLVVKLKPHQVEAVQFVWDCTFESLKRAKTEEGSGCILAHCMGLGKTLSLITYIHTMLTYSKKTNVHTCVVVAPLNTVLNWQYEFEMWQEFTKKEVDVYEMSSVKQNADRAALLKNWHRDGGVLILGYDMLRNLSQGKHCRSKNMKKIFTETLVDPGPDLVICDEGHILKNDQSAISKAMNRIKSRRRVVLTGTPLQNNLMEYHCMVDFVKPNLLGTSKEFRNRFVNPITNGQCADSTAHDVKIMKRRAHILHEKLNGCVQRKDYSSLTKYLPPKHEYVIAVRLSPVQIRLYEKYLEMAGFGTDDAPKANRGARLFSDYQALMRIWTHPWVLKMDEIRQADRRLFDDESDFVDDSDPNDSDGSKSTDSSDSSTPSEVSIKSDISDGGRKTRSSKKKKESEDDDDDSDTESQKKDEVVKKWTTRRQRGDISEPEEDTGPQPVSYEWWAEYVNPEDEDKLELGGKLVLLFEILRMSEEIGDKVLVFSQSLLSLDLIEHFLELVDQKRGDEEKLDKDNKGSEKKSEEEKKKEDQNKGEEFGKHWTLGEDYFRMDGSHSAQARKNMAEKFNDPENYQCRLFLISTKAGGLGINLVAANRVIIFDASWNPSHDVQSIFRVYRFGQEKPVYVYRFLAQGTMEEKIYERQVTKQSLSQRVIDEHQIDRHFNANELAELYTFRPDRLDDPNRVEKTPMLPKDFMLAELMKSQKDWFVNYHEHDSLLENKIEEILDEDERKAAWEEYENERKGVIQMRQNFMANMPNMGFNNMVHQMQQQSQYGMPYMYSQGFNMQAFTQQNLLQLVQDMKQRYPHLPQEQLTQQVQTVIRQMVSRQIAAQQDAQKRQMEQKELQHQRELQRIQDQIRHQQMQLMQATMAGARQGMGPGTSGPQAGTSTMQSLLNQPANASRLQQMREARK